MTDTPELPEDPVTVVHEFFAALAADEVAEALELLHPEIVWKNTSLPDVRGKKRVGQVLAGLARPSLGFAVDIHHIAATGDVVLTDRTDYLRFGKVTAGFWVSGTLELREGRIVLWHDHFSKGNVARGVLTGIGRALTRRG